MRSGRVASSVEARQYHVAVVEMGTIDKNLLKQLKLFTKNCVTEILVHKEKAIKLGDEAVDFVLFSGCHKLSPCTQIVQGATSAILELNFFISSAPTALHASQQPRDRLPLIQSPFWAIVD